MRQAGDETPAAVAAAVAASAAGRVVQDLVTAPPSPAVGLDLTVAEARRLLRERGHDALPVADEDGHLVGVVTRAELDAAAEGTEADRTRLRDAVRMRVVYCFGDADVALAAATMRAAAADHLAVLGGEARAVRFLGLLARSDLPG